MRLFKRSFFITLGLLAILLLSACGGSSTTTGSSSTSSNPTPTPTPTIPTPTPTPSNPPPASTGSSVVKTATATVAGKSVTILTDAQGMTLYYFTPDSSTKAACTGGCASTWPPLLFTGSGSPTAATKLPGELEVYPNANGKQITYNNHPLYTFTGDTAAGQTSGNGIAGKWFVATTDLAKNPNG